MSTLETLKINNCGLGPEGGRMIADALSKNQNLKLRHFEAIRDRLENEGIIALAKVFGELGTLEQLHITQNGIKSDGMTAILTSLADSCPNLTTLYINDNWLKRESTPALCKLFFKCPQLKELDMSDLNMGQENATAAFMALKESEQAGEKLEIIRCNYNDIDAVTLARRCLEILLEKPALKEVSFIGNQSSGVKDFKAQFDDKNI